ncbi:hypothetical protein SI65_09324 [Aspergillus cristatus]|uniref:Nucleolar protein Dnt1-like N-terminal domain-containing protein n=1 Tax=Aspergillus cristatus TaxID=573508 RepID=A0A1E3B361_ASPCR|nr:hypothetical protein SI65_09324 [Aspergillus cristatus]
MVFLRLTVKIYPPEQIQSSSSFSFRSILSSDNDAGRNSSGAPAGKPASFLLVLENPEDVTLGGLAKMIQAKWTKLRPNAEPLQIKKMLDDNHDTDDLDVDMTAADVFVDRGLGQIDGRDQRGCLRVIQRPTPYSPARFPSVTLDWDAAAEDYERRIQAKREAAAKSVHKFPTITEEDSQAGSVSGSQNGDRQHTPGNVTPAHQTDELERRRDMPVLSVEKEHEIPGSPARWDEQLQIQEQDSQDNNEKTIAATPQHRRFESQELGGSPTPTRPSAPSSEKTAATSQPRAATRGRAANRTINRIASESKSPHPAKGLHLTEQTPSLRHKTRSLTRRRISQFINPVEDDEEGEANGQDNGRQEGEGGEKDEGDNEEGNFDYDGDVAMDDDGIAPDAFTATEEAPEQDLANGDAPATRLGKRKKSQEELQSNKEPRLDRAGTLTQETSEYRSSSPSAMRKRERAPSFSGPGRRPSITEQHSPPRPGLGLGITKSPPRKQPAKPDLKNFTKAPKLVFVDSSNREQPSNQTAVTAAPVWLSNAHKSTQNDSIPAKPQTPADKVKSALRKEASADKRRSVSFSEENSVIPVTEDSRSRLPSGSAAKEPKKAKDKKEKSPNAGQDKPPTPGITVYPGGVTAEKIQQILEEQKREAEKKKQEQEEMDREMREAKERNASSQYLAILAEIHRTRMWISENKNSGRQKTQQQLKSSRSRLDMYYRELDLMKANPNGHSKTPEKKKKKKKRASEAAAEISEETSTPSSNAKDSGSAKKKKAARRESSSTRSPAKSPPKQTENEEAAPTETTNNGDSAQTTEEPEAGQETETAPAETPSHSKRKTSPAEKAQHKEPVTASPKRTRCSRRSLRAVDGADAMDIDQPSQLEPQPEPEPQQEDGQEDGQEMETEPEQEGEQEQEQPEEPEPEPEPQPHDQEEDGAEQDEEQRQGQEQEQAETQPEPESEPEQQPEPEQREPTKGLETEQEPAQDRESEQEQQPEPEPEPEPEAEAEQEAEPQSEQQPQEPEKQPEEPEMVPETSQPQAQEPQGPQAEPSQPWPEKPQSQQSRLLSQEQSQSFPMSDDVNLPEIQTIRTLDQSKKPEERLAPQPTTEEPKPVSQEDKAKESSSEDEDGDETESETGSDSDSGSGSGSDDDDEEEQGPELTKADLLRRANGANGTNGTSFARNSMTKSPAPSSQRQLPQSQPLPQNRYSSPRGSSQPPAQSQPQPHIQPFQSVNKASARASLLGLKNMITSQKQEYDAQLQEARMATVTRKKDVFDPPSDSESEDESESDSDSDSDSDNESGADDGDIQSSGTVGKLRKALQKK